jgi:hypothetical protein
MTIFAFIELWLVEESKAWPNKIGYFYDSNLIDTGTEEDLL